MEIKILGYGCSKCDQLYKDVVKADQELQTQATITKVDNAKEIAGYGVMRTPAIVINGRVTSVGKIPASAEIKKMIETAKQ